MRPTAQQRYQQQQAKSDEAMARALQAQEYNQSTKRVQQQAHHSGGGPAQLLQKQQQRRGSSGHAPGHAERQAARDEQLKMALEANPEAFVSVPMLYVRCTLNDVPLKAFVDTGAQMTVMSLETAQKCKLGALIDQRFRGVAQGVGAARIVGRVNLATLRFGRAALDTTITVMEQRGGPELLLGLDVMRKYSAVVDLGRNALVLGGETIPFV